MMSNEAIFIYLERLWPGSRHLLFFRNAVLPMGAKTGRVELDVVMWDACVLIEQGWGVLSLFSGRPSDDSFRVTINQTICL